MLGSTHPALFIASNLSNLQPFLPALFTHKKISLQASQTMKQLARQCKAHIARSSDRSWAGTLQLAGDNTASDSFFRTPRVSYLPPLSSVAVAAPWPLGRSCSQSPTAAPRPRMRLPRLVMLQPLGHARMLASRQECTLQ